MKTRKKVLALFFAVFFLLLPQIGWGEDLGGATIIESHADDAEIWWVPLLATSKEVILASYPSSAIHQHLVIAGIKEILPNYNFVPMQGALRHYDAKQIAHNKALREALVTDEFLTSRLDQFVRDAKVIITHSPWGEYGHPQHLQIWRVVKALAQKYGKDVWAWSGIVSSRAVAVYGEAYVGPVPYVAVPTDHGMYFQLRQVYIDAESSFSANPPPDSYWWDGRFWTWDRTWQGMPSYSPPPSIVFLKMIEGGKVIYNSYRVEDTVRRVLLEYQGYY